jgi:hypothetical protein
VPPSRQYHFCLLLKIVLFEFDKNGPKDFLVKRIVLNMPRFLQYLCRLLFKIFRKYSTMLLLFK